MTSTEQFHTAGRRLINQTYFKASGSPPSLPTILYLGLRTLDGVGSHPSDAAVGDTLGVSATLAEVSGGGYSRIAISVNNTNFTEAASSTSNSTVTISAQTFSFTSTLTGLTHTFLATSSDNTGVMLFSAPLGATQNPTSGSSITVSPTFTLSG